MSLRWAWRRLVPLTVAVLAPLVSVAPGANATSATPCAATAAREPQAGHNPPIPAPVLFAPDFPRLNDCEWGFPLGGWGGARKLAPRRHVPVIFVHGNQADAENWFLVADRFKELAGYSDQEMYALSYNGLENAYAGIPTQSQPSQRSTDYWSANPSALCCSGGKGASDDPNVPDLYNFVRAVQAYTGSDQVDIVAHSLGVTITRKMLLVHPELRPDVVAAVMIAGANHGTTVCRGLEATYFGCDEIAPGTAWLKTLNAAGEAPGPTRWMTVYNGADNADPFFMATPGLFDDRQSPHLDGAVNLQPNPNSYHNDLRVSPPIVRQYLDFLVRNGQAPASTAPAAINPPGTGQGLPNTSR
ncbi:MAG: lipase family protein [Candidatus Dormibacteraeota bacterium]|nr:lipase family protein [Candidatus Dormibacteraeota bacterium]